MRIPFAIPAQATRAFDIVGLGQNSIDYVASVGSFPVINTKARLERFAILPGGQVATARDWGGGPAMLARLATTKLGASRATACLAKAWI